MSATPSGYARDQPEGFSNRIENIAIVGAGGHMGQHLTENLLATGKHTITAITRPSSTNKLPDGVRVLRVDYSSETDDDVTTLVEALRGQQVLLVTMNYQALNSIKNLVRAAATAGVPYILPNWFGHDAANEALIQDSLMTALYDNVREVERLGVNSYFLLVCNFWYEFSLGGGPPRYGFDFKNRSLILYNGGKVVINTSTWPQCGRAIANLLSLKQLPEDEQDAAPTMAQFTNKCIYTSSFRVSQQVMFESVKRVTGTTDADWSITHENTEERYKECLAAAKKGHAEGWMKMGYSRMFFDNGDGDYETSRGLHNDLLGLPSENLDEYTAIGIRMGERGEIWP
ncbi:hypothetical protein N0V83_009755 [Neocucurbitaria cava]|uniref:NmrA-like domain-containing protein n=1 Tax=Neocucurbitaria cava TaxID=798079 RepID=A0A9W9CHZ1_9PLEO|nr:hypothetical protein N0V83_009755 [Neocucurbitaria cava]